jgi:septation ring formation regulator EzrA
MDDRVTNLEKIAETLAPIPGQLAALTARFGDVEGGLDSVAGRLTVVESQIVQLRTELRDEFSAVRGEMSEMGSSLRGEIAQVREDIATLGRETAERFLQFGSEMRTLFEESLGRRKVIAEGHPPPDAPPPLGA